MPPPQAIEQGSHAVRGMSVKSRSPEPVLHGCSSSGVSHSAPPQREGESTDERQTRGVLLCYHVLGLVQCVAILSLVIPHVIS